MFHLKICSTFLGLITNIIILNYNLVGPESNLNFLFLDLEFSSSMELSEKKLKLATIKKEVSNRKLTLDQILDASLHLVQRSSTQVLKQFEFKLLR